jgi:hypothetical protein
MMRGYGLMHRTGPLWLLLNEQSTGARVPKHSYASVIAMVPITRDEVSPG